MTYRGHCRHFFPFGIQHSSKLTNVCVCVCVVHKHTLEFFFFRQEFSKTNVKQKINSPKSWDRSIDWLIENWEFFCFVANELFIVSIITDCVVLFFVFGSCLFICFHHHRYLFRHEWSSIGFVLFFFSFCHHLWFRWRKKNRKSKIKSINNWSIDLNRIFVIHFCFSVPENLLLHITFLILD